MSFPRGNYRHTHGIGRRKLQKKYLPTYWPAPAGQISPPPQGGSSPDFVRRPFLFGDHFCLATIFVRRPFLFGDHFCSAGRFLGWGSGCGISQVYPLGGGGIRKIPTYLLAGRICGFQIPTYLLAGRGSSDTPLGVPSQNLQPCPLLLSLPFSFPGIYNLI